MKKYLSIIPMVLLFATFAVSAHAEDSIMAPTPMPQKLLCTDLTHDLSYGSIDATTGGDVTALQVFLNAKGYMTASPVGVFGPQTRAAVIKFQTEHGLPAYGFVGPMTRPIVKASTSCGAPTGKVSVTSVAPSSGPVGAKVTIEGTGFASTSQVMLGTAAVRNVDVNSEGTMLTFEVPNSAGPYCAPGNVCIMLAILIQPGTYDLSVRNVDGAVSNSIPFIITDDSGSKNAAPVIDSLDAPVRLTIGQTGTWTLHASVADSQDGETLHYSVNWGDEGRAIGIKAPDGPFPAQLSSTFTHSYSRSGSYTPVFTVSDDNGNSATASATINVDPVY